MLETFHLHSSSPRPPLRIGLFLDSFLLPAWIETILEHLRRSNFAWLELAVLNAEDPPAGQERPRRAAWPARLWRCLTDSRVRRAALYSLYSCWDAAQHPVAPDPFRIVDCTERLAGLECIPMKPLRQRAVHRFTPEQVQRIRDRALDVILCFGFNIIRGEVLNAARYGVWSYHHGDNDYYRGGPAHFWELFEENPFSGVLLQVLNEELDGGLVLCKAHLATEQGSSLIHNRVRPYWVGSLFVIRKLHELHQYGWEQVLARTLPNRPHPGQRKLYRIPTNREMVGFLARRLVKSAQARLTRREHIWHWRIALRPSALGGLSADAAPDMRGFRWIESPKGHFYADPFPLPHGGKTWLFFEDFRHADNRGVISCAEILEEGTLSAPREVLQRPYHLSYPFVFEDGSEIYMIPESGDNRTVELYRATAFPYRWEQARLLFSGVPAWDTTLWMEDGLFWFFVTMADPPGAGTQLFLFYADGLLGRWNYHPANPICPHEQRARGAGAIFRHQGRRIRPSQDVSRGYGYSFAWNEITRLTPTEYQEQLIFEVLPSWAPGLAGTHTYNRTPRWEVVDGKISGPRSRFVA